MISIHFFKNTVQVKEQFSKYGGQNSEFRFVYIYITNISDIMITNKYNIIQYTNYYQCMIFLSFSTLIDIVYLLTSIVKKSFSCMICNYFLLDKHICAHPIPNAASEIHTGKKPYYHVLCELTMTHSGSKFHSYVFYITAKHINLICHMTTHTGEKPIKCFECSTTPLSLIRSPQITNIMHTVGNLLACTRLVKLNYIIINPMYHMGCPSKERPYPCIYCGRILPNSTSTLMPSFF